MAQSPPHSHFTAAAVCPPDERASASQHRARVKSAEQRHQENIQTDFAAIDARMNMTPGQMISDWRVQNGLPPLDVAAWMAELPNIPAPKAYGNQVALMDQHDTRVRQSEDRTFEEPKTGGRKGKGKVVRFEDQLVESPPLESSPIPASSYSSPVESSTIPAFKMQSGKGKEVSRLFDHHEDEDGFSPLGYHFPGKDASEHSKYNSMTRSSHVKEVANPMVIDLSSLKKYLPDEDVVEYPKHNRTTRSMKGKEVAKSFDEDLTSMVDYLPGGDSPEDSKQTRSKKGKDEAAAPRTSSQISSPPRAGPQTPSERMLLSRRKSSKAVDHSEAEGPEGSKALPDSDLDGDYNEQQLPARKKARTGKPASSIQQGKSGSARRARAVFFCQHPGCSKGYDRISRLDDHMEVNGHGASTNAVS